MKVLQSSLFRAVCSVIVGVLLIVYRQDMMQWLMIAIGVMFFLSGVFSVAAYIGAKKHYESLNNVTVTDSEGNIITGEKPNIPIVGIGSLILGIILALMPTTFISGLMYILSALLILGAVNQFVALATANKFAHIGFFYWIMPTLIFLTGIFIFIKPMESASLPLLIIGWCMVLYGVVECIDAIKIHQCKRKMQSE